MRKTKLTIKTMIQEARVFCEAESSAAHPELYGVTDGKAVGTYVEHRFQEHLKSKYGITIGNSTRGIDFPSAEINTDMKVTSIRQPQSSCPFKTAEQKIFGLGYNILLFVYEKIDTQKTQTSRLNFVNCSLIEKERTADYQTTKSLIELVAHQANEEEIIAFLIDRNLPADEILLSQIARKILAQPPLQGYLTVSNALQWRLQYDRIVDLKESVSGITKIIEKE